MDFSIAIDPSFRKASIEWLEKKDPEYKGLEARNEDEYVPRLGRYVADLMYTVIYELILLSLTTIWAREDTDPALLLPM